MYSCAASRAAELRQL